MNIHALGFLHSQNAIRRIWFLSNRSVSQLTSVPRYWDLPLSRMKRAGKQPRYQRVPAPTICPNDVWRGGIWNLARIFYKLHCRLRQSFSGYGSCDWLETSSAARNARTLQATSWEGCYAGLTVLTWCDHSMQLNTGRDIEFRMIGRRNWMRYCHLPLLSFYHSGHSWIPVWKSHMNAGPHL